ncbi:MAG: tetratricopeptide repeat protein [Dehalococcoidia bacterium]|nr:tetratricopeptide repeat protein [Dehalococcoidia bacterium]
MDPVTFAAFVVTSLFGGGLVAGLLQLWLGRRQHQVAMDKWERIQQSWERQIESAKKRGDTKEVNRLRQEYAGQLEAWRAQQGVTALAPRTLATEDGPTLTAQEVERFRGLLAAADPLNPGALSAEGHWLRGNSYYETGNYLEALASYDKALGMNSNLASAWSSQSAALGLLGSHNEALASAEKALALDPNSATAWSNRSAASTGLGHHAEALASVDKAIELDPNHAINWNNRSAAFIGLGRHEEALASCDRAIELNPNLAGAWNNRGLPLRRLGREAEALESFKKAEELDKRGS